MIVDTSTGFGGGSSADPTVGPNGNVDLDEWKNAGSADEDLLFMKQWRQMAAQAEAIGLTKEQARAKYNEAGRPRGASNNKWMQGVTAPANAVNTDPGGNAHVTVDPAMAEEVRRAAGLGGTGADGVAQLDRGRGQVDAALATLQGDKQGILDAGERGRGDLVASLEAAKLAGNDQLAGQQDLIAQLQAQARGEGPSAALALYKLALGRNIDAQASLAAGVRGGNAAAAARNAGIQGEGMMRESAGTAAAIRAQEQQAAQGLLGNTLAQTREGSRAQAATVADIAAQIRGQDVGVATAAAGSQAQIAGLTQAAAALEESKRNAASGTALALLQLDTGVQGQNVEALLQKAGLGNQYTLGQGQLGLGYAQLKQQKEQQDRQFWSGLMQTVLGGGLNMASAGIAGGIGGGVGNTAAQPIMNNNPATNPFAGSIVENGGGFAF
jgi:hypothetical protein